MIRSDRRSKSQTIESRELPSSSDTVWIDLEDSEEHWREFLASIDAAILEGETTKPTSGER